MRRASTALLRPHLLRALDLSFHKESRRRCAAKHVGGASTKYTRDANGSYGCSQTLRAGLSTCAQDHLMLNPLRLHPMPEAVRSMHGFAPGQAHLLPD